VAEALVRQAGARGLPVAVYRPSLVSGDTGSGAGPTGDVLSALIKGCIQMGAAPDLDWVVDCCPVDYVAEAIVRLSRADRGPHPVFHLANPQPRHWRECVLWLTLYGYPMRLIPYAAWRARLDADAQDPAHALHTLRPFFLRPAGDDGLTLPELYEDGRRSRVDQGRTHAALHALELACPALSASLLDRYVDSYVRRGFLPPVSARPRLSRGAPVPRLDARFFERLLRRESGDETLRVTAVDSVTSGAAHSILTELTAWRSRSGVGLRRYRLGVESEGRTHTVGVMVKVKPRDTEVIEVGHAVARLCDGAIGHAYARFRQRLGLTGCHRRELAIYGLTDERLRAHMPAVYGRLADDRTGYVLVLEDLSGLPLLDTADDPGEWSPVHVEAALRGLAEIHAVWYRREASLRRRPWLGPVLTARDMGEMRPLWRALAEHAAGDFAAWAGSGIRAIQRALVDEVDRWWASLEAMPRTLIHHDFNPRNIALRPTAAGFRLCAYDWELATLGVPQHDLAELLCFVLVPDTPRDSALHFVETHRTALERATGEPIDPTAWRRGFRLSLQDLLLNRFAMYALAHRIRRQAFLPRIVRTWRTLYQFSEDSGRWPGPGPGRTRHAEVGVGVLPSK
jgi:aminoglycoside/choline kinase family phosphotransferase